MPRDRCITRKVWRARCLTKRAGWVLQILGAILAGGKARRFGSDKAEALYRGERLIDHAARALLKQCDELVVCGREEAHYRSLPDAPGPGLGPLGGLNAALIHARCNGYAGVLSAPCDVPDLPDDLARLLVADLQGGQGGDAAYLADLPLIGFWPIALQNALAAFLEQGERKAYRFARSTGARAVMLGRPLTNINRPEDLPE